MFLITGASGFLGQNLVEELKKKGPVVALTRRKPLNEKGVMIKIGDLTDINSLRKATQTITGVIHLAAIIHSKNKSELWQANVEGTKNIVKLCQEKEVKRLIFLSTMNVKLKKPDFYGKSKKAAEKIVTSSGLLWTIIRPTMIYGQKDQRNLAKLADLITSSPFIPVFGKGNFLLQPLYVKDLVWFIIKILKEKKSYRQIYEVGGGQILSFNQTIDYLANQLKKPKPRVHFPLWLGRAILPILAILSQDLAFSLKGFIAQQSSLLPDVSLAIKDFAFSPCTFREGIRKTFER